MSRPQVTRMTSLHALQRQIVKAGSIDAQWDPQCLQILGSMPANGIIGGEVSPCTREIRSTIEALVSCHSAPKNAMLTTSHRSSFFGTDLQCPTRGPQEISTPFPVYACCATVRDLCAKLSSRNRELVPNFPCMCSSHTTMTKGGPQIPPKAPAIPTAPFSKI